MTATMQAVPMCGTILARTLRPTTRALCLAAVIALLLDMVIAGAGAAAAAMNENENATQSGCQICGSTGDCARAYQGGPGQYCGNWLDLSSTRQSCCCPTNAVCKLSNYACNCAWVTGGRGRGDNRYGGDGYGYGRGVDYTLAWLWWLLGSLMLLLCCGSIFFMMCRKRESEEAQTAYATPAYVSQPPPTYGSAPSAPIYNAQPVYGNAPTYVDSSGVAQPVYGGVMEGAGNRARGGGMSAGTGAALGGGAGLLGGFLLGEAMADAGRADHGYGGYDGGYDGGAGGSADGGGDFGGDF